MAVAQQSQDASSADTVVSQVPEEKTPTEAPAHARESEPEMAGQHDAEEDTEVTEDNGLEQQPSGAPLDKTPSQAAKMGKKKIVVVMGALCVRHFAQ